MTSRLVWLLASFLLLAGLVHSQSDYVNGTLVTPYEEDNATQPNNLLFLQRLGFDSGAKRFRVAQSWFNNELVSHYLFQVGQSVLPFTMNELYIPRRNGSILANFNPILRYHWNDSYFYNDIAEIFWVEAYNPTIPIHSVGDIRANQYNITPANAWVNLPVVPTGSTLEDPDNVGSASTMNTIPIWYRGQQIEAFAFETNNESFAQFFFERTHANNTNPNAFRPPVVNATRIPQGELYHLNQYENGVNESNHGIWPRGMRNVLSTSNSEFTAALRLLWVIETPLNFTADMARSASQLTETNQFKWTPSSFTINCPRANLSNSGGNGGNLTSAPTGPTTASASPTGVTNGPTSAAATPATANPTTAASSVAARSLEERQVTDNNTTQNNRSLALTNFTPNDWIVVQGSLGLLPNETVWITVNNLTMGSNRSNELGGFLVLLNNLTSLIGGANYTIGAWNRGNLRFEKVAFVNQSTIFFGSSGRDNTTTTPFPTAIPTNATASVGPTTAATTSSPTTAATTSTSPTSAATTAASAAARREHARRRKFIRWE